MKKAYQAIDYSVMKQSTVLSYGYFLYLGILFVLYSNYIPNQKGKTKSILQMRCIKTIKLRLTSGFLYSLWKKLPSKHQMITC
jgi:hypothetical protein